MIKNDILKLLYIEKNYSKIKELLQNSEESWSFDILAKVYIQEGNLEKALAYYTKAKNESGIIYCHFLKGEINKAKEIIKKTNESSSFLNWLTFLIHFLGGGRDIFPSYLQIRNFYEQDLDMLIKTNQINNAQLILNENNFFEQVNKEVYKYSARVLFNHDYNNEAEKFLTKSLDIFFKDPETHYLLGEVYLKKNEKKLAIKEFKKAIDIPGEYMPANKRLKDLQS